MDSLWGQTRCDSGPVLFGQERVGLGGERFTMYKFRTMQRDAERQLQDDPVLWNDHVDIDAEYVREWSVWLDVKILVRTPLAVLSARGAF